MLVKNKKQKTKGMIIGTVLIGIILTAIHPITVKPETVDPRLYTTLPETPQKAYIEVSDQIRLIAKEKQFKWPEYLVKLAYCESRLYPIALNGKGNKPEGSIDRGLFQISDYWHSEISSECAFDIRCSTEFTINMINSGRQHEWVCNSIILNK